ncbi:MAG: hypothetical protein WD066_13925 [Planctomycetaceae bacterium]
MFGTHGTIGHKLRFRLALPCAAAFFLAADPNLPTAEAAGWMFEPSYYSHELPPEVAAEHPRPVSRSAYRRAWAATQPGAAIRGAWRFNRVQMRSGNSVDTLIIREDWFNERP